MTKTFQDIDNDTLVRVIDGAFFRYKGDVTQLEKAIGALVCGRHLGWRILFLTHDRRTLYKYEKILGFKFRDVLPEVGEKAKKSVAWYAMQKIGDFWKAVKSEIPGIRTTEITTD